MMTITTHPPPEKRCEKKKVAGDKGRKEFSRRRRRMTRRKHKEEVNGKDEEGEVKGLRKDCARLITEIIICNRLPPETRAAPHRRIKASV